MRRAFEAKGGREPSDGEGLIGWVPLYLARSPTSPHRFSFDRLCSLALDAIMSVDVDQFSRSIPSRQKVSIRKRRGMFGSRRCQVSGMVARASVRLSARIARLKRHLGACSDGVDQGLGCGVVGIGTYGDTKMEVRFCRWSGVHARVVGLGGMAGSNLLQEETKLLDSPSLLPAVKES